MEATDRHCHIILSHQIVYNRMLELPNALNSLERAKCLLVIFLRAEVNVG